MSLLVSRLTTSSIYVTRLPEPISVRDLDRLHRQRGMVRIGFHFVVQQDGTVDIGRPVNTVGAHTSGQNHNSIGIALAGPSTAKQRAALRALIADLEREYPDAVLIMPSP